MLFCLFNVTGIRERNKLGLIITSADVNPYQNTSSLLFFFPPDRSDDLSWLQLSWSTLFLHSCAQHITCVMSTCRVSFIRLAVTTDLTEEHLIQDRLHWWCGGTKKKKKKQNPQWSLHLQRYTVRHTVMWGRLHRENNRYLRWMQPLGLLFLVLLFFNLFTRSSFLISWSGDITFKMPQYVLCCSHLKGGARCRTNTSDLNGHCGPVNESQGGLGEQRAGVSSSLKQRCWNRQRRQNTAGGNNRPSTHSSQMQCDRNLHKRNAVFSSRFPLRLSAGLSLSLPHTSTFTLWFTLSTARCLSVQRVHGGVAGVSRPGPVMIFENWRCKWLFILC